MIECGHPELSVRRQCVLLGLNRASLYYVPAQESAENLALMRVIDEYYTRTPFYGSRRMTAYLQRQGYAVNRKRVQRLMHTMGLEAIYPRPRLSLRHADHQVYPYLLHDVVIHRPSQVWSADITYVPMRQGVMYLVAILDWYSRYVLSWQLSNTMDVAFCLTALEQALAQGRPEIFNTDQGAQFTSLAFTMRLAAAHVAISMDGRGRVFDNIFVERLWRTVKYEDLYLKDYGSVVEMEGGLAEYFWFYNHQRIHQALDYRTPAEVHCNHEQVVTPSQQDEKGEEAYLF
jgi:putative transposase